MRRSPVRVRSLAPESSGPKGSELTFCKFLNFCEIFVIQLLLYTADYDQNAFETGFRSDQNRFTRRSYYQSFYNGLLYTNKNKRGISLKTVKSVHRVLHKVLEQAVYNGYIHSNPANSCVLPRVVKKQIKPLVEDQIGWI